MSADIGIVTAGGRGWNWHLVGGDQRSPHHLSSSLHGAAAGKTKQPGGIFQKKQHQWSFL